MTYSGLSADTWLDPRTILSAQNLRPPFADPQVMVDLDVGDQVYISRDLDKNRAHDNYMNPGYFTLVAIDLKL